MTRLKFALLLMLIRLSVGILDNCWKSDRDFCKIEWLFEESEYRYKVQIICTEAEEAVKNYLQNITSITLNGCQSDKNVNPFDEIIDPESVQSLTIEMFYMRHLNNSYVQNMRNLKTLSLKNNEILSISEDVFKVFLNLEELSFVENISPSFNFSIMQTLKNLKVLTIIQPTWTVQLDHLLRIPSIKRLHLSVDALNSGLMTSEVDYNTESLEELIITNTSLNLKFVESRLKGTSEAESNGILRDVSTRIILTNNTITSTLEAKEKLYQLIVLISFLIITTVCVVSCYFIRNGKSKEPLPQYDLWI